MESWDWVFAPGICGTADGGFTFVCVQPIARLFTNWSATTPTHIAGVSSWPVAPRKV